MNMFRNFFNGRYRFDNLNIALFVLAAILIGKQYVSFLGLASLGYAAYRMFSKDVEKRERELQWFNGILYRAREFFAPLIMSAARGLASLSGKAGKHKMMFEQRKDFVFIKCPNCKNTLKLPRNKGRLSISCPVCRQEFIKKT